jgi:hypothetical protein
MSHEMISELLQECLAAYEAGLSPEECLSAYPSHRSELEPLLRQALSLRVAYAGAPAESFKTRVRERLMFAAGREVTQALAAEPSPRFVAEAKHHLLFLAGRDAAEAFSAEPDVAFVENTRRRLLNVAGAAAQESLRSVPPPRLPFWWNTRRKLLEAASRPRTQPEPRPVFGAAALRLGMSMAALVLVFAIGGVAYLLSQDATPSAASEIARLERELDSIEARSAAGQEVPEGQLSSLLTRTSELAGKLGENPSAASAAKLQALSERQLTVVEKVYSETTPPAAVAQAQQQLEEKAKLLASNASTPASAPTAAPAAPTSTPSAVPTAVNTPVLPPPSGNVARVTISPTDGTTEIRTATLRFVVPKDWSWGGIAPDSNGVPAVRSNPIAIGGNNIVVFFSLNGQIEATVPGQPPFVLRSVDALGRGTIIGVEELVARAGASAPILRQILETYEFTAPVVTQQPPPPPPPAATSTPIPLPATSTATSVPATSTPVPATATPAATSTPAPATATRVPTTPAPAATP